MAPDATRNPRRLRSSTGTPPGTWPITVDQSLGAGVSYRFGALTLWPLSVRLLINPINFVVMPLPGCHPQTRELAVRPSHPDDPALTRLLFPHPPARPAAIVARAVGLHRAHAHGLLEGLDFHIAAGELVVVLGGAHSGKSALIWALAGLDRDG